MDVAAVVAEFERLGVVFSVSGEIVKVDTPEASKELIPRELIEFLDQHADELVDFLLARAQAARQLDEQYETVFNEAASMCAMMIPAGMLLWRREKHPDRHADLTGRLSDFLSRLWAAKGLMKVFRRALAELAYATARAATLFREPDARR